MLAYILISLFGLVVLLCGIAGMVGSILPQSHTVSVSVDVASPRQQVWAALDDVASFPSWLPGVDKVDMLPDRDGRHVFRQYQGRNAFVLEETVKEPPALVTRTITDGYTMFSGSWEHRLEDLGNGRTRVTVTENGTVKSPIPRAIMKYAVGYDFYLKKFAAAMQKKFGA